MPQGVIVLDAAQANIALPSYGSYRMKDGSEGGWVAEAVNSIKSTSLLLKKDKQLSTDKNKYNETDCDQSSQATPLIFISDEGWSVEQIGFTEQIGGPIDSFKIDKKSDIPVWVQLRQRLVYLIASGFYQAGDQLPTVRELAVQLDINYHTVNKVYHDLEEDGFVEKMVGRGTFVTDLGGSENRATKNEIDLITREFIEKLKSRGMTAEDIIEVVQKNLENDS